MCLVFASGINLCSVINMTFYAPQLMCVAFHSFLVHLNQQIRASPESLILKTNPESVPSCDTCWLKLHKCILYLVFRRSFKQLDFWLVLAIWVQRCHPLQPSKHASVTCIDFPVTGMCCLKLGLTTGTARGQHESIRFFTSSVCLLQGQT